MNKLDQLANDLKNRTLLITGGSGFFGKNLGEILSNFNSKYDLGMKIYSLARNPIKQDGVDFIQQDVTLPFNFNLDVDYIIHAATPVVGHSSDSENIMNIIINGTKNALDFAERSNCKKVLLVSSGAVYGEQPQEIEAIPENYRIKENFFDIHAAYGSGKRISELLAFDWANRTGVQLSVARCFAFSGRYLPIDQHLAIGNFVRDALSGEAINIKSDGMAIRSYMDSRDLVDWLMTILLRSQKNDIFNVGSDEAITMKELALKVSSLSTKVPVNVLGAPSFRRNRYVPSVEKAKKKLDLKINISLDESIKEMIAFNKR